MAERKAGIKAIPSAWSIFLRPSAPRYIPISRSANTNKRGYFPRKEVSNPVMNKPIFQITAIAKMSNVKRVSGFKLTIH